MKKPDGKEILDRLKDINFIDPETELEIDSDIESYLENEVKKSRMQKENAFKLAEKLNVRLEAPVFVPRLSL